MKNRNIRLGVLALVLACGFAAFWSVVGVWAAEVAGYSLGADGRERLSVLADGRAVIAREEGGKSRYFGLDGEPVDIDDLPRTVLTTSYWPGVNQTADRLPWTERVSAFSDMRSPATFWYFVQDGEPGGAGWFEGYDSERKTLVGYIGVRGFRPDKPEGDDCFRAPAGARVYALGRQLQQRVPDLDPHFFLRDAGDVFTPWLVQVCAPGDRVYHVDLRTHEVRVVFQDPRLISASIMVEDPFQPKGSPGRLAVRFDGAIVLFGEGGREVLRYPLPPWLRGRTFGVEQVAPRELILRTHEPGPSPGEWRHRLCWSTPAGFREAEVVLRGNEKATSRMWGMVVPSPLFGAGVLHYAYVGPIREQRGWTFAEAWVWALAEYWQAAACAWLIAAALAVACYLRQRRFGATTGECVGWALFVLVLGLPGYVGYRFCRPWPVLERCGDCGAVVPRDADGCRACDAEFAAPARLGTEVFA